MFYLKTFSIDEYVNQFCIFKLAKKIVQRYKERNAGAVNWKLQ